MMQSVRAEILKGPFDPGGQPNDRSGQPLELSLFAWNVQGGLSANKAVLTDIERYRDFWKWPTASKLLTLAEEIGFDNQLQYGRWSGYGGASGWNDASLDFATAGTAAGAITHRLGIYTTVHTGLRYHPMHVAKIGASTDHLTQGRWGMNIVAGANVNDFRQFGITTMESGPDRYARADEFVTLLKYLWTSEQPVDFEGEFYQAYGASVSPMPVRQPRPVIMNAGQSRAGLDFACRQADWVFVAPPSAQLSDYADMVERVHTLASRFGRSVRVAAMCYAVIEETDAAARHVVETLQENVDTEAVYNFVAASSGATTTAGLRAQVEDQWAGLGKERFLAIGLGLTGFQLFGGYESIAERLRQLHNVGVESAAICFWDPLRGLHQMRDHVMPVLRKMGLRH